VSDLALFEIDAEHGTCDAEQITLVAVDEQRGHIGLVGDEGRRAIATFCDVGPELHMWAFSGAHLTPATARSLGVALTAWADRRESGGG
jgi:hypothetical protein